ncbi:hypothetical protein NDU88_000253 [Pleurodeles waltl]|uniref:Uncharacterized protein n=1 Tax=Pleurodeles waltl TaxID=8319 RepID=A0AAV7M1W9_PLEWA|nr:hypothetical protein NDU88_000253 [Pleurodeles waltl]
MGGLAQPRGHFRGGLVARAQAPARGAAVGPSYLTSRMAAATCTPQTVPVPSRGRSRAGLRLLTEETGNDHRTGGERETFLLKRVNLQTL